MSKCQSKCVIQKINTWKNPSINDKFQRVKLLAILTFTKHTDQQHTSCPQKYNVEFNWANWIRSMVIDLKCIVYSRTYNLDNTAKKYALEQLSCIVFYGILFYLDKSCVIQLLDNYQFVATKSENILTLNENSLL